MRKRVRYGAMLKYLDGLRFCRWQIFFALVTGIINGFASGFGIPILLKYLVGEVFSSTDITPWMLAYYCSMPFALIFVRSVCGFLNTYLLAVVGQAILKSIRLKIFQKIQRLPLAFFHKTSAGDVISRAANDVNIIQSCFVSIAHEIFQRPITLISGIIAVIFLCLRVANGETMLLLLLLVGLSAIPIVIFGRWVWEYNLIAQEKISHLTSRLTANLSTVQEVRAFVMEDREVRNYRRSNSDYSRAYLRTCKAYYVIVPSIEIWAAIGIGIAACYGYHLRIPGDTFLALGTALFLVYDPVKNIGRLYGNLQCSFSALSRIESLLDEEEVDPPPHNPAVLRDVRGDIRFEDVTFCYDPKRPVLQHFSLRLEAGRSYALVGPSGAGKTTLASLLLRFYEVQGGRISVDGVDISHLTTETLRQHIAFVPQAPTLVSGTVYENILWGRRDATQQEVERAVRNAHADKFINALPQGIHTPIGEDGHLLSGGQRQRIAIARAFLRDAPILILDEATSALDTKCESDVRDSLKSLFSNRTVIIISHRFSLLSFVDEVIVLDCGAVVCHGTHGELLRDGGLYRQLYLAHTHGYDL
ncbi:MAG: ABC transporter ATP-binding protein/permease [Puniceicoccales bacterium]|jgi:subfamily B ATP-binding cassette protein MsbA|nr:ABC transporter ATP-binding protein/permease [Puniceicoccales bacterium]